jgi:hypothetical protein
MVEESTDPPEPATPQPDESQPGAYPLTDDDPAGAALTPTADGGGTRFLARFLTLTPFLDLHQRAGSGTAHRIRGWVCFLADFIVRAIAIALMFVIVACVAWKTLAPLPQFWHR